jgi:hypothetical protein
LIGREDIVTTKKQPKLFQILRGPTKEGLIAAWRDAYNQPQNPSVVLFIIEHKEEMGQAGIGGEWVLKGQIALQVTGLQYESGEPNALLVSGNIIRTNTDSRMVGWRLESTMFYRTGAPEGERGCANLVEI